MRDPEISFLKERGITKGFSYEQEKIEWNKVLIYEAVIFNLIAKNTVSRAMDSFKSLTFAWFSNARKLMRILLK